MATEVIKQPNPELTPEKLKQLAADRPAFMERLDAVIAEFPEHDYKGPRRT